jgi:hypothetical protein
LERYWARRSRRMEAMTLLTPVLERPEARTDPLLLGRALVMAALVSRVSDTPAVLRYAEQGVELARQLDDGELVIQALAVLSSACYFLGQAERGLPFGLEAVERARPLGDDVLLAEALSGYLLCLDPVDPARSGPLFDEAIACLAADAEEWSQACVLHGAAQAALDRSGEAWQEPEARYRRESLAQIRAHLGEEQPERDYARGMALSSSEVLDLAFRKDPRWAART